MSPPLASWTSYSAACEAFSGTAEYTTTVPALSEKCEAWMLDLKEIHESASVYVNNQYVGTLIGAPYCIEIPIGLLKGDGSDILKVRVSNLMANRISYLDKRGKTWRKFYNTNFNARFKEDRGADGLFTAKNWTPKVSGICGVPSLTPLYSVY